MNADEPTFDASSVSRNRDRLLDHDASKLDGAITTPTGDGAAAPGLARALWWWEREGELLEVDGFRGAHD